MITKHLTSPVPPLSAVVPNVPPGVESAIARALEKEPSARFATATEFAQALTVSGETIASGPRAGSVARLSIAVLPIVNIGGDATGYGYTELTGYATSMMGRF